MNSAGIRIALALLLALLAGCVQLPQHRLAEAEAMAIAAQPEDSDCDRDDRCALPSPLMDVAMAAVAASTASEPVHHVLLLEGGEEAMVARLHLMRGARESLALQTFIFGEDEAGFLVLSELIAAARRGVRVQVLLDQLFSVDDVGLLVALASAHANFELRMYNPTFQRATTTPLQFAGGIVCCFRRFNQRMHTKLLLADDLVGITGGRNYTNSYFDWDPGFNYRDRDILVAGPVAREMRLGFDRFWAHERAVPITRLHDVARSLLAREGEAKPLPDALWARGARAALVSSQASDPWEVQARLVEPGFQVGRIDYLVDPPEKHERSGGPAYEEITAELRDLVLEADEEVLLQTPYLVVSREARRTFRALREREDGPVVRVSTNSLAATDAWPVYAISHKYKRTYLRDLGFIIHEYRPHPADAPIDIEATGAGLAGAGIEGRPPSETGSRRPGSASGGTAGSSGTPGTGSLREGPVPLATAGIRISMHAKSVVIDERIGVVGTHNFDPRSDNFNTENAVIVHDEGFARALAAEIRRDMAPENSWLVARRPKPPILSGLDYSIGKLFEMLPVFDLWPLRYATSYELVPGCEPVPEGHPEFQACWRSVGQFPEVDVPFKGLYTRLMTAFGAGLSPIL